MLTHHQENEFCKRLVDLSESEQADQALADFIEQTYTAHPNDKAQYQSVVSDFAGFHETDDHRLRALFRASDLRAQFVAQIMQDTNGNPEGVELASKHGMYALLLRDASSPGKVRYQVFDKHGFASHHTEDTWEKVLFDAYFSGFKTRVSGILDSLSAHPDFFSGRGMQSL